ncbi:hypothetical protein B0H16DRAFT_1728913 [Mycena metata]|uniref:F-box domain-containing protein n=1 Tax=Mycena metata TaxID=1033252 RepID=A0AAD7N0J7_9AGAR|nr:hypothetical protein B0H16DRAFT_1728913 [Mycena metata]
MPYVSRPLWDSLPYDIRRRIIDIVLAPSSSASRLRFKLCVTSSAWLRFILSHPHYWTHIVVTSRASRLHVLRQISLATPLPLHLRFSFVSSPPPTGLGYLLAHLDSVAHFTIETDSADTVDRLHAVFGFVPAPRLQSFRILYDRTSIPPPVPFDHASPMPWFGSFYPDLQTLHLRCAIMPLAPGSISALRDLTLAGSLFPCRVLAVHLADVISSCPLLENLTLFRVCCPGIDDASNFPVVHSSSISFLRLGFSGQYELREFVRCLDFPSLTSLSLDVLSEWDVAACLDLHPTLTASISALTIRGSRAFPLYSPFSLPVDHLFPLFPALISLDLTDTISPTFSSVLTFFARQSLSGTSRLSPALSSLRVSHATLHDLHRFVTLCAPVPPDGFRLQELHCVLGGLKRPGPPSFQDNDQRHRGYSR